MEGGIEHKNVGWVIASPVSLSAPNQDIFPPREQAERAGSAGRVWGAGTSHRWAVGDPDPPLSRATNINDDGREGEKYFIAGA